MADLHGANILITGGAGLIGSHIADQVLAAGAAKVVILDDFVRGRWENIAGALATGRASVVDGDICEAELVASTMAGIDLVFHQAALRITHCAEEPERATAVMVNGLQNVLKSAHAHGVSKVLAASSASVYGEASYLPMDEQHPFNNRTFYGAAKIANEQMLRAYNDMLGLRYVALRPFNVYGPRMDVYGAYTEVMIRWLERLAQGEPPVIFGDGAQTMDFVYVEDVAQAYLKAALADADDVALNVGSGTETSLRELCTMMCAAMGRPDLQPVFQPARKINPVTRRRAATDRARALIGFEAGASLPEGLRRLIAWHTSLAGAALAVAR